METSHNIRYIYFQSNEHLFKNRLSSFDFDAYFFWSVLFPTLFLLCYVCSGPTNKVNKKIHIDIWFEFTRGVCLIFVENLCNTVRAAAAAATVVAVAAATTATTIAITVVRECECLVVVYHDNTKHTFVYIERVRVCV